MPNFGEQSTLSVDQSHLLNDLNFYIIQARVLFFNFIEKFQRRLENTM